MTEGMFYFLPLECI